MSGDRITLAGLSVHAHHGVFASERREGQDFLIDLVLWVDLADASRDDDLTKTVDYGRLAAEVTAAVARDPVDLIETVAERVARVALSFPAAQRVRVTVHKPHAPIEAVFADVSVTVERDRAWLGKAVVLALGSNLGSREDHLSAAVAALADSPGVVIDRVSPFVSSVALTDHGRDPDKPAYLNAVVLAHTTLEPHALLALIHRIESAGGRERTEHWGDRTLDIDIIDYDGMIHDEPELTLPHPRAHERDFVLEPWHAVDPSAAIPGRGSVAELLNRVEAS